MSEVIKIARIIRDGGTQSRIGYNVNVVNEYADRMKDGDQFPPVELVFDGTNYYLYDGFHRVAAAENIGRTEIAAHVVQGTLQDAQWQSCRANATHGLRRNSEDKQRAIVAALKHPFAVNKSDHQIARHVGVDHKTVGKYREQLEATGEIPQSDVRTGQDGRQINTANIGRNPVPPMKRPGELSDDERAAAFEALTRRFPLESLVKHEVSGRVAVVRGYLPNAKFGDALNVFDPRWGENDGWLVDGLIPANEDDLLAYVDSRPAKTIALEVGDWVRTRAGHEKAIVRMDESYIYVDGDSRPHRAATLTKIDPPAVADDQASADELALDEQLATQVNRDFTPVGLSDLERLILDVLRSCLLEEDTQGWIRLDPLVYRIEQPVSSMQMSELIGRGLVEEINDRELRRQYRISEVGMRALSGEQSVTEFVYGDGRPVTDEDELAFNGGSDVGNDIASGEMDGGEIAFPALPWRTTGENIIAADGMKLMSFYWNDGLGRELAEWVVSLVNEYALDSEARAAE